MKKYVFFLDLSKPTKLIQALFAPVQTSVLSEDKLTTSAMRNPTFYSNSMLVCALFLITGILSIQSANAQEAGIIVNEASNGPSGNKDWVELLVVGDPLNPTNPVDLTGWFFDDNNGDFEGTSSTGITGGAIVLSSAFNSVSPGSLIVIYNQSDKDAAIAADDPTDANNDKVYILPGNHVSLSGCTNPTTTNPNYIPCTGTTASWSRSTFRGSGDVMQTRKPDGTFFHGFSYGNVGAPFPNFPNGNTSFNAGSGGAGSTFIFGCGDWTDSGNISADTAANSTPGVTNSSSNANFIENIRLGSLNYTNLADPTNCSDPCDPIASGNADSDNDGVSDICDLDDDNDGIIDILENAITQIDSDLYANRLDLDSDDDGISDTIEYGVDISGVDFTLDGDSDGIPDAMDASGGGTDSNGNGVIDSFDPIDTDGDAVVDVADIDSDNDGIYDVVEVGFGANDTNNDGRVSASPAIDVNGNGHVDAFEGSTPTNTVTTTPANFINTDSDGDGCSDADEAYFGSIADADGDNDGEYGNAPITVDPADGSVDGAAYDSENSFYLDGNASSCIDSDNDGVPDSTDLDDDNDGILDTVECGGTALGFSFLPNGDFGVANTASDTFFSGSGNGTGNPDNYNTYAKPMPAGILTTYGYQAPRPADGNYAVVTNSIGFSYLASQTIPNFWLDIEDLTIDATGELGYFALFNAAGGAGTFFEQTVPGLTIGERYKFTSGIINLFNPGYLDNGTEQFLSNTPIPPNVTMIISDTGGNIVAQIDSGDIPNDGTWKEVSLAFTATAADMVLTISNNTPGGIGNDFGIDNVSLELICDFDGDGIPNSLDLDSDNDGIADVIESGGTDADMDGRADDDDDNVNNTASNGVPTTAGAGANPPNSDSNANDQPDYLDIDADDDGIPDNVEAQPTDTYQAPSGIGTGITDGNMNGLDDNYENGGLIGIDPENTDLSDNPDYIDEDSDNDTILDIRENGDTDNILANVDTDGDGLDDAFDDIDDSAIDGATVNDGINPPDATNLGDEDNDLGTGGDVDYRDISTTDSDGDGISDVNDLDDDNDGVLDSVEGTGDTDGDGIPDALDLDSDNDGIPDITEAGGTDSDGDGQIDYPTPGDPMSMNDTNNDGLDDGIAASPLPDTDTDGDGLVDRLDLDADNDGIADIIEAGGTDANADGQVDYTTAGDPTTMPDADGDGFIDSIDTDDNTIIGVGDGGTALPDSDTDGDGFANRLDLDSDNDGIHDVLESGGIDSDGNGTADDDDDNTNNVGSNGIPTSAGGGTTPTDTGANASPDYLNLDSDEDGCSDANEAYSSASADGDDGGQFGTSTPATTGAFGLVSAATYDTGIVASVTDATDATACDVVDTDGDGVLDDQEITDGTDPNDPCDYVIASITEPQSGAWLTADCDGDGVTNGTEIVDGTNPEDPCDFNASNITLAVSGDYLITDCDGDGVTNGTEIADNTDPEDPCDFLETSVTLEKSGDWLTADCDGDMITNGQELTDGTNPNDPCSSIGGTPPPEIVCDIIIESDLVNPGLNDGIFRITNIEAYPDNDVKIYNRWGILVFETQGYDNTTRAFRGISNGRATVQMNKELPVGVYFYIINYRSTANSGTKSGYLYVNR
ncbi:MAG: gliding motility-associated C-terminal domain-containing protein [Maribacter sp.]|uniref:T9SS type B sorting domain-containing protein n=1 Tax=Maribacter sp. TaxID=1897614 RepID=UPI003299D01C